MFGERLKLLRAQKKMTQKELGQVLGISSSTIGMYEREKRTTGPLMLKAVSSFFEVSIDYLLGSTNDPVIKALNSNEFHVLLTREEMDLIRDYRDFNKEEKIDIKDYFKFKVMKKENKSIMFSTSENQK